MAQRSTATVDASFWIHAGLVRNHPELLAAFDVTVPTAVAQELGALDSMPISLSGKALRVALDSGNARILDPHGPLIPEFHAGERAVLTLAMEQRPGMVPLVDEMKAYVWAVKKQLPVLSVPLWLATRSVSGAESADAALSKIRALVEGRHFSIVLAHEPALLLVARLVEERRR